MRRVRARVEGTVQGVGFRPFVYRLASELDLAGFVLNDERGVLLEVEGGETAVDGFLRRLADGGAAAGGDRGGAPAGRRARGRARLPHPREPARRRARRARLARHRDLRGLPRRAVRPLRPPLPLPVRQLHELRAALHDRARRPLRPAADHDGRLRDVHALRRRSTRTRPTGASTPSPTRARSAGRPLRLLPGDDYGDEALRGAVAALRDGADRRGQGHRRLPPRVPRGARAGGRGAARAQAPRGQAVRGDGARRRRGARARRADRRGGGAAGRPRPPIVLAPRARRRGARSRRRSRRARPTSACCCPTRRCTTCCSPTSASRS